MNYFGENAFFCVKKIQKYSIDFFVKLLKKTNIQYILIAAYTKIKLLVSILKKETNNTSKPS